MLLSENGNLHFSSRHSTSGNGSRSFAAEDVLHIGDLALDVGSIGASPVDCARADRGRMVLLCRRRLSTTGSASRSVWRTRPKRRGR